MGLSVQFVLEARRASPGAWVTAVVTDVGDELWQPVGHPAGRMSWTSRGTSVAGDHPHLVRVDSMVVVREHDPQADDVAPGNAGMLRAEVLAEGVRRLADDLQKTLHREPPDPVLVPSVPAKLDDRGDFAGGIQDVGDAFVVAAAHRSTDSARMARSRLFSPPAETTSTARPSSASSSREMRIRSNRELPRSKATSRSRSLSSLSSPRAAEPKRRTLLA